MCFLAGGDRAGAMTEVQARMLMDATVGANPRLATLMWSRLGKKIQAVAMVVEAPGKTGALYASPADAPGVDAEALGRVVAAAASAAIAGGLSMVQALLPPDRVADADALKRGGFIELAELIYMRKSLAADPSPVEGRFEWMHHGQYDDAQLARVIEATYRQSLDCPALEGLRRLDDVIVGHRACGRFSPETWWIARVEGSPAGCILVNELPGAPGADVVYMGVVPEFRGRGVGRSMLRHSATQCRKRGCSWLSLAVDSRNEPALRLYLGEGFAQTDRRMALAALGPRARAKPQES